MILIFKNVTFFMFLFMDAKFSTDAKFSNCFLYLIESLFSPEQVFFFSFPLPLSSPLLLCILNIPS